MLMVAVSSVRSDATAIPVADTMRRSRSAAAEAVASSVSRMAIRNSSPPKRATMSPGRRLSRSRAAISASTASPAAWPKVSFTALKRSTSATITAKGRAAARASAMRWRWASA
jgi:hypothetical protein